MSLVIFILCQSMSLPEISLYFASESYIMFLRYFLQFAIFSIQMRKQTRVFLLESFCTIPWNPLSDKQVDSLHRIIPFLRCVCLSCMSEWSTEETGDQIHESRLEFSTVCALFFSDKYAIHLRTAYAIIILTVPVFALHGHFAVTKAYNHSAVVVGLCGGSWFPVNYTLLRMRSH